MWPSATSRRLRLRGDEAAVFSEHGRKLTETVSRWVRATLTDIDDAWAFAWVLGISRQRVARRGAANKQRRSPQTFERTLSSFAAGRSSLRSWP
jgi:hypothetical protein